MVSVSVLLPPNASPLERNLEQSMALYGDEREVLIDTLWQPDECPVEVLPFFAWGLGVRRWDPAWPIAVRRRVIADAIDVHRIRGTIGAVRAALDDIGAVYDLEERPAGAAFTIGVSVYNSNTLLGETDTAAIRGYLDDVKRFSVHYDLVIAASLSITPILIAAGVGAVQIGDFRLEVNVEPIEPSNQLPVAAAGADQNVAAGARVTLDGSTSSDPDGSIASYAWVQVAGDTVQLDDAGTATPEFDAPTTAAVQTLIFRLTVTDDRGGQATDMVDVAVAAAVVANQLPVAAAGADQNVAAGARVTLDGSTSSDPDGSIASYAWVQVAGDTVQLDDAGTATPEFDAPTTAAVQTLIFRLTVTDDDGASASDQVDVAVAAAVVANQLPVAAAGADQNVAAGARVTLDGSTSSDPDGSIASYAWVQVAGDTVQLDDAGTATPEFDAPTTAAVQTLMFRLTVTDDDGASASDQVDVAVAAAAPAVPVSYRFDSLEALRGFATFEEGNTSGRWEIIAAGSTTSNATGPSENSAGPYAATDASGGNFSAIADNSVFDLDVEEAWPLASGRVLRLRCCIQGEYDVAGEGLMVRGMVGGAWEDISLIRGWAHSEGRLTDDRFDDYGGVELRCVQDGGWVDVDVAIGDQYEQVRLRLVAEGGNTYNHDIALWSAELRNP